MKILKKIFFSVGLVLLSNNLYAIRQTDNNAPIVYLTDAQWEELKNVNNNSLLLLLVRQNEEKDNIIESLRLENSQLKVENFQLNNSEFDKNVKKIKELSELRYKTLIPCTEEYRLISARIEFLMNTLK